ncbi:hypothetical protein [Sphingobacterium siyangense]|uniref:hypothetical protein n=1 Tax=Sphingobacterium siyangense TaxID=459529 RepID=UPI003DA255E1
MSAIAALRGYRTQFLYSLHYILSSLSKDLIFRLEGEEDLDVLDRNGQLLYAIQLKNLSVPITLSDVLSERKTSFIKRFLVNYSDATPILVSYGEVSQELQNWEKHKDGISAKEKKILKKYKITVDEWKLVKSKTLFMLIKEEEIAEEIEKLLKNNFPEVDPIPTIGFLLNWLQLAAEKQNPITTKDVYSKIQDFAIYITERIAVQNQYGLVLRPLHKVSTENTNQTLLEKEFYNATLTRYEHILLGLDVKRANYLEIINDGLKEYNTIILKGASGQGKTALLYSYVHNYVNDWLSYELNIQQDPITTQQSIQAIASVSKKLEVPTILIINVYPNSTDWLQIIKDSAHLNHIRFLVAIRNEDWYRASAIGVQFEHKEIDLSLSKDEAQVIYNKLNDRNKITHFTDFEQSWIQTGDDTPLLEFVYSITQGNSLQNKLKQQIQQLRNENNQGLNPQIEFLRIVSLADSVGAKIDVSKLNLNIDYQFIIEKLENEYLIKKSLDRKYIQGLHLIRSQKLVELLFDEFTTYKEEYAYKCIPLVDENDLYLFLLQMFYHNILKPDQFITDLNRKIVVSDWSVYAAILKSSIWLGTKNYVKDNRTVIDECRTVCGGAWTMFTDFMFASNYDKNVMLDILKVDDERREKIDDINRRLSSNQNIFNLSTEIINKLDFPDGIPSTIFGWKSFGESLFWLKNIPNQKEKLKLFEESTFEAAFKMMDSKSLSKLMLGMYSYSEELDAVRKKYIDIFIQQIKKEYDVIHLSTDDNEVYVHYIIDILKNDIERSTNDFIVRILDILRTALPDRIQFNSQGYGHRLQTFAVDYDETHKTISIENMPLEEWVNINSTIINLYEYQIRPEDWNEYSKQLNQWETVIHGKINEFNTLFEKLFKGSPNYMPVVPIMKNMLFETPEAIKQPKSIIDPLGIYGGKKGTTNENQREQRSKKLQSKYAQFFKSVSDFKGNIEIFIKQSGATLYSKANLKIDEAHVHDDNIERLSQINLYDAIGKLQIYNNQYKNILGNIDIDHHSKISTEALFTTASIWKDFLKNNIKGERSAKRIFGLKSDFESKLIKDFKQASRTNSFSVRYTNNKTTNDRPVILIDGDTPFWALMGYKEAYKIVQQAIDDPEYTSLKYLVLQFWFSNFYFIQTIQKKSLSNQWNEVALYNIKDKLFEELSFINSTPQPIEAEILENLNIESWSNLYPEFNDITKAKEAYGKLLLLVDHLYDLRIFDKIGLKESDQGQLQHYIQKIGLELQESFQTVLDSLFEWINLLPFDEDSYIVSEEEQEYFKVLINIKDHIFPEPKGDEENFQLVMNMEIISKWVERLKVCTANWGIFILLLYGKYIHKFSNIDNTAN